MDTDTLEALPQYTPEDLSIRSILIYNDIDIISVQTDSETFVLSPDLSTAAASDMKLNLCANLSTLQAIIFFHAQVMVFYLSWIE